MHTHMHVHTHTSVLRWSYSYDNQVLSLFQDTTAFQITPTIHPRSTPTPPLVDDITTGTAVENLWYKTLTSEDF